MNKKSSSSKSKINFNSLIPLKNNNSINKLVNKYNKIVMCNYHNLTFNNNNNNQNLLKIILPFHKIIYFKKISPINNKI